MSALFEPFTLKDVTLRNRIAIPPMCQYMAEDGMVNDWHLVHLAGLARGGAGLVVVEATAVSPEGRITPGCTGLWSPEQQAAWTRIVDCVHQFSGARIGIHNPRGEKVGAVGRLRNVEHLFVVTQRRVELSGAA